MRKKLFKFGGSLGLILPARYLKALKLKEGSSVRVTQVGETIRIESVKAS